MEMMMTSSIPASPERYTAFHWLTAVLVLCLATAFAASQCACSPSLTPMDHAKLERHEYDLTRCREQGRDAKDAGGDYKATYDACKKDGGL